MSQQQRMIQMRRTPWLSVTREKLAEHWSCETGHVPIPGFPRNPWSRELADACELVEGHLSLPCSLKTQANQIGLFLLSNGFDGDPVLFFKLYVMLLGEFAGQLRDVAGLMELTLAKPPKCVSVWANCWAKHSLAILVQHHPQYVFADDLGPDWAHYVKDHSSLICRTPSGEEDSPHVIDTEWMCEQGGKPNVSMANDPKPVTILIPPLMDLLKETVSYYRVFLDAVLVDPCCIQLFETTEHKPWRPIVEAR